jgi:hypothetical protein
MKIVARHYETLRASYEGSRSLRRGTKVYDNDRRLPLKPLIWLKRRNLKKDNHGKQIYLFYPIVLNLGRVLNVNIHKLG